MPRRHNSILLDRTVFTAGAAPTERDLPINPLTFLTITIRALNTTAHSVPSMADLLGAVANLEILLDGRALVQGSLPDLAVIPYALWGVAPVVDPLTEVDTQVVRASVHIPFGRRAWAPDECLPTTRKGDLTLRLTPAAAFADIDTVTLTVECRQVLDSAPARFLKYTTSPKTPTVAGEHEVDLLTGPDYLGVLLYGTTIPTAGAATASIAKLRLKVDDIEQLIPETRHESIRAEWGTRRLYPATMLDHIHQSDLGAAYAQYQDSGPAQFKTHWLEHYLYLDFDPLADLSYRLITRGRSRTHLVITADVADLIRVLGLEIIPLTSEEAATA